MVAIETAARWRKSQEDTSIVVLLKWTSRLNIQFNRFICDLLLYTLNKVFDFFSILFAQIFQHRFDHFLQFRAVIAVIEEILVLEINNNINRQLINDVGLKNITLSEDLASIPDSQTKRSISFHFFKTLQKQYVKCI